MASEAIPASLSPATTPARCTARADHQDTLLQPGELPSGCNTLDVAHQTDAIGIVARQGLAILQQGIDCCGAQGTR